MIVPQRRGEIEQFQPVLTSITNNPELAEEWRAATDSRNDHVSLINAARGELGCTFRTRWSKSSHAIKGST
jgi:hypothetical protein